MRALIVDDSRAMRILLRRALTQCGFDDFAEAADGKEALGVLAAGPIPDMAFVDWNMEPLNGIQFVRAVRSYPEYDGIGLLMVTSESSLEHVEEALAAGADEYVMKPFTPEILGDKLALVRASRE
jgi:two-component system chemotaxis response regulator CheY